METKLSLIEGLLNESWVTFKNNEALLERVESTLEELMFLDPQASALIVLDAQVASLRNAVKAAKGEYMLTLRQLAKAKEGLA